MATLETSLEANYHRRTDKATYRGTSYRSAQKDSKVFDSGIKNLILDSLMPQ